MQWLSTFKFNKKLSDFHWVLYLIVWGRFLAFCASSGSWADSCIAHEIFIMMSWMLLLTRNHSIIKPHFHSDTGEMLLAHLPNKVNVILSQTGFLFNVYPKLQNPVMLCCQLGSVASLVSSALTVSGRFTCLHPFLSPYESICSLSHVPYQPFIWNCLSFLLII